MFKNQQLTTKIKIIIKIIKISKIKLRLKKENGLSERTLYERNRTGR